MGASERDVGSNRAIVSPLGVTINIRLDAWRSRRVPRKKGMSLTLTPLYGRWVEIQFPLGKTVCRQGNRGVADRGTPRWLPDRECGGNDVPSRTGWLVCGILKGLSWRGGRADGFGAPALTDG